MKKIILLVVLTMAVLSGCGKDTKSVSTTDANIFKGIETETILVENIEVETIIH